MTIRYRGALLMTGSAALAASAFWLFTDAAGAATALFREPSVSQGDKLQFLGALLGSAAGVFGAVCSAILVEDYRRWRERRATREPMIDALNALHASMANVAKNAQRLLADQGGVGDLGEERDAVIALLGDVNDALALLDLASQRHAFSTFAEARELYHLTKKLQELQPILQREQGIVRANNPSEAILRIFYGRVGERAADLTSTINRTRNTIAAA